MQVKDDSRGRVSRFIRAHILGFVAIVLAMSGGAYAASTVKKGAFNKLKNRVSALESKPDQVGAPVPATLPPSGPAGGDLTGNYPDPLIGPNAVGGAEIAANSVTSSDVGTLTEVVGTPSAAISGGTGENGNYDTISASVECPAGDQIISAWGTWSGDQITGPPDNELWISEVNIDSTIGFLDPSMDATIVGGNDEGASHTLTAVALCLD